jgi:hypothetical protein
MDWPPIDRQIEIAERTEACPETMAHDMDRLPLGNDSIEQNASCGVVRADLYPRIVSCREAEKDRLRSRRAPTVRRNGIRMTAVPGCRDMALACGSCRLGVVEKP